MANKVVFNAAVFFGAPLYAGTTATSVTVVDAVTVTNATIYSSRAGAGLGNPYTITTAGVIEFYVDPGRYNITATLGADTVTWNDVVLQHAVIEPVERTASFTIDAEDFDVMNTLTGAGTINITIPLEASDELNAGYITHITHMGTGTATIVEEGAVDAEVPAGGTLVIPVGGTVSIYYPKLTTDKWKVIGQVVSA